MSKNLDNSPPINAQISLSDGAQEDHSNQVFYLEINPVENITYQGHIRIEGIKSDGFTLPTHVTQDANDIFSKIVNSLNEIHQDLKTVFVLEKPSDIKYSTIYLGNFDLSFNEYGYYYGLAEKIDLDNQNHSDNAFVFIDNIFNDQINFSDGVETLVEVIAHEAKHLLGFEHQYKQKNADNYDHDPFSDVAFKPYTHVEIAKDVHSDLLDDGALNINGQNYNIHPKIAQALRNYPDYYYAGTVGPDGFPDILMGAGVIHPEETGTWLTRVLDMAWQAQNDPSFSNIEKSQILAWTYGFLTHAAGDIWAHNLVNEFAEGVFPSFGDVASSLSEDKREVANALRHLLVEEYIQDATINFDNNPDRQPIYINDDGIADDVSDDSTPAISYAAPNRFIYESLIRPVLFDPTHLEDTGIVASIKVNSDERQFIRTDGGNFDGFVVGQKITTNGFNRNNGVYTITEITTGRITVKESLLAGDDNSTGDERLFVKIPYTAKTFLTIDTTDNSFNRKNGNFLEDGIVQGMRFGASGFNQNNGDYTVKEVTEQKIIVVENLQSGDQIANGDEQLIVQGKRGIAIDTFFKLRELLSKQVEGKETIDFNFLVADLIDKFIQGETPTIEELENLYTGYLQTWINNIDQGLRHWSEFGLAFTRAFYDPQSRRDLQNKERGLLGEYNLIGIEKENNVGVFDVLIEELDDLNGDGLTTDSFINKYLLPMLGVPRELAMIRTIMQTFGSALDEFVIQPLELAINPLLVGIETLEQFVFDFIKDQIEEVFGIDFELFDFLIQTNAKLDLASIEIGDVEIPIFKSGDRELLNQYLGIAGNDDDIYYPAPDDITEDLKVSVGGITINFHENPTGALKDEINFDKGAFSAYQNSVILSKLLLLQETPFDGESIGSNQLSQLFSNVLTAQNNGNAVIYDASLLNLNGNHGGNILTTTLPGIADSKPWLLSIDSDHSWRQDSLTTIKALFRVNTSNDGGDFAVWEANLTPGNYRIQTTWLLNVTQLVDNLENSALPDQNLTPASNAKYKIYDGATPIATVSKDQRIFEADAEDGGLSFGNLGEFSISSGHLRIELENVADGNVVAGPIRVLSLSDGSVQQIKLTRDSETLIADSDDNYREIGSNWIDIKYNSGTGNFPLWESEILRSVYRELFTDWQNNGLQFPALGDTTSDDPNSNSNLSANPLPSHANEFGPNIPDTPIIIPIPNSLKNLILDGLNDLVEFADDLDDLAPFTVNLPIINQTLAEIINLPHQIDQRLRTPFQNYFNNDATPTIGELFEVIENQFGNSTNNLEPVIEFDLDLQEIITETIAFSLGEQGNDLNINFDASATLDILTNFGFLSANDAQVPKFTVGFDLSPEIDSSERVYIRADRAIFQVDVDADNLNLSVNVGNIINAGIVKGAIDLIDAGININFNDPNQDGKFTLREITDTPITTLLTSTATGSLQGNLPISINDTNASLSLEIGNIALQATDLFNPETFTVELVNNFDAESLLTEGLNFFFANLRNSLSTALTNKIPLLRNLDDIVLDFIDNLQAQILDFTNINDILLTQDGYILDINLDGNETFILPLGSSLGTSSLGLNINGDANVTLNYAFDWGFGIDLDANQTPQFYLDTSSNSELILGLNANLQGLSANAQLFEIINIGITDNGSNLDSLFTLDISDGNDNKWRVGESLTVNGTLSGSAALNLQGIINGSNDFDVDLGYVFPNTALSQINLNQPSTTNINYKGQNFNNLTEFASSFNTKELLSLGLDYILEQLRGIVNEKLSDKIPLLGDFSDDVIQFITDLKNGINNKLINLSSSTTSAIQQALFELLTESNDGYFTLLDTNNDGDINQQDIELTLNSDGYFIAAKLEGNFNASTSFDTELGLPNLGFSVEAQNATVGVGYELNLAFGIDQTNTDSPQFYFDTNYFNDPELNLRLNAGVDLQGGGKLGFLQLDIEDKNPAPEVQISLSIDVEDGDHQLRLNETPNFTPDFNADVDLSLGLTTSFGDSKVLPSIMSDFTLDWQFDGESENGNIPSISFDEIQLDLGTFFNNFADPIFKNIQEITKPIEPIAKFLTRTIEASDSLIGEFILKDLLGIDITPLEQILNFVNFVNSIPLDSDLVINLGSFNLTGNDPRSSNFNLSLVTPFITKTSASLEQQLPNGTDEKKSLNTSQKLGIQFPIIENPQTAFGLLLGKNVELFNYKLPKLQINKDIGEVLFFVASSGPVFAEAGMRGTFKATSDIEFGYDTYGLTQFLDTEDIDDIFNGFYIKDEGENPLIEAIFGLEVFARGGIGFPANILSFYAELAGGVEGSIGLDLIDPNTLPNSKGKVRKDELIDGFTANPLSLFDLQGGINFILDASIGYAIARKQFVVIEDRILEEELLNFTVDFRGENQKDSQSPFLATNLGFKNFANDGILRLNIGANAHFRNDNRGDVAEVYVIQHEAFTATNETILVSSFGVVQDYKSLKKIIGDAGEGDDNITLVDRDVLVPVDLAGGNGNDTLVGGNNNDTLSGDNGDDFLMGSAGGDDYDGGKGIDTVSYRNSPTGVLLNLVTGEATGDAIGDIIPTSVEGLEGTQFNDTFIDDDQSRFLLGREGNDFLQGNGGDDTLEGEAGNDTLIGGLGDDFLRGGDGDDSLTSDDGNDVLTGENGDDTLISGLGDDTLSGGDGNDSLTSDDGNDVLTGENGNDTLISGLGDDTLSGGDGDDFLTSDDGNDVLRGENGNDTLISGLGDDTLSGGDGNDYLSGGDGIDSLSGGFDNDTLHGGNDDDFLFGDNLNDLLYGEAGNDWMDGGLGYDTLEGAEGHDTLIGGYGRDVLVGGEGNDILIGSDARDILTGGAGLDQFVYLELRDRDDIITDFEVGIDHIVLTEFFENLDLAFKGYQDVIDQGYLSWGQRGDTTIALYDEDGELGIRRARPFIYFENHTINALDQAENFII